MWAESIMQPQHNSIKNDMPGNRHKVQVAAIREALKPAIKEEGIELTAHHGATILAAPGNNPNQPANLRITPMFPGSLTRRDIVIKTLPETPATHLAGGPFKPPAVSSVPDADIHYAQFRPLTDALQSQISTADHNNHILLLPSQIQTLTTSDINRVVALCPEISTLSVLIRCSSEVTTANALAEHLRASNKPFAAVNAIDVTIPSSYLSMLSKSNTLLARDETECVDSVMLNTPTGTWDDNHPLSQSLQRFKNGGSRDRLQVDQHAWLTALQMKQGLGGLTMTTKTELHQCIAKWLSVDKLQFESAIKENVTKSDGTYDCDSIGAIIPPPNLTVTPTASKRLMNHLDVSHRKLAKFRESPSRFFNDSRHPWLRPLQRR